ncbi:hypothetical protein [Saccharopolyspora shandongensis]|uniref:hypothetical protein n=1 Tax=Saccharopolyspora shandongensis TaxID=418495 RepID=UPI0033E886E0
MGILSNLRRGNASKGVRAFSIAVVMLGAVATAMLSLVLEDLLPKGDPQALFDPKRLAILVAVLLFAGSAVWLRYGVRQTSGTLFSVQVLDEGMRDRTQEQGRNSRAVAAKKHMSIRVLHRWLDFETSTANDVIDLQADCREAGAQLQLLVNTTPDDGKHSVAPVMLWPIAMAVGGYLPARTHDFRMVELPTQPGEKEQQFELPLMLEKDLPKLAARAERIEDATGERIGVHIGLAKFSDQFYKHRFRHFRAAGVRTCYTISDSDDILISENHKPVFTGEELKRLSRLVTAELFRIKENHPDEELVVFANMPKTVAFAAGWQLMQYRRSFYRNTYLMHYDSETETYIPMRVRSSQPATGFTVRQIRGGAA